jgi:hypothetical protein
MVSVLPPNDKLAASNVNTSRRPQITQRKTLGVLKLKNNGDFFNKNDLSTFVGASKKHRVMVELSGNL